MPELPEVENYARDLKPLLVGRRIQAVEVLWPRTVATPSVEAFVQGLVGRQIVNTDRRGKYLLFPLDDHRTLVVHLRMTGQLHLAAADAPTDPYVRLVLRLSDGQRLYFRDQRKFGRFYLVDDPAQVLGRLGPEPLQDGFTPLDLFNAVQGRRAPIKALLLDQHIVAGVGNIYADEALFLAGIDPRRSGGSLTLAECSRLHACLRRTLAEAIREGGSTLGGSSLGNYQRPLGVQGRYQLRHRVFRRTGQPCPVCGTPIQRVKVAQRSTHFCPRCQGHYRVGDADEEG